LIDLARLGGPVACLGLALLLVASSRRDRLAGLAFAALGGCVLAVALGPSGDPVVLTGVAVATFVGVCALAAVFRRFPWLLPVLALACVPARVGIHGSKLLVPLYVVAAAAAVQLAWELLVDPPRRRELRLATWPLAAFVAWVGISLAWSKDVHEGAVTLLAFYLPFTILALAVARLPWSALGVRVLSLEITVMAVIFAVVGFYQYETRDIFQNPKVIFGNAYAPFFRVNSVFWDPSVYGRFLVVAMVPSLVLLVLGRARILSFAAVVALAVIWLGLLISFSQSSFAALLVVVIGCAVVAWRWRALIAIAAAAAVLAGIAVGEPQIRHSIQHHTSSGLNSATSGRASLVANGIRIAAHHPVTGVGVGGFKRAYAERVNLKGKDPKKAASHNTPITVAAEEGVVGLALLCWLVGALLGQAFRWVNRTLPGRTRFGAGLALSAIFVHSLFYNAFFEDPMTWGLIGLVALAAPRVVRRPEVPASVEEREAVPV
jgi:putative inorganic carbon (HCO3(-)) transporter